MLGVRQAGFGHRAGDAGAEALLRRGCLNHITLPDTELKLRLDFAGAADGPLPMRAFSKIKTPQKMPLMTPVDKPAMAVTAAGLEDVFAQWLVTVKTTPTPVITLLMPTLELLGEPVFLSLFGVNYAEPYATFKHLWFDHPLPVYRLAGLVLAMIYRTEELRRHKNG